MNLTPKQQQIWDLKQEGFSERQIAKQIGLSKSAVHNQIVAARNKAKHFDADPGFSVYGKSTLYDIDGEKKIEWIKTTRDKENVDQLKEAFEAALEAVKPLKKVAKPTVMDKDSLSVYPMGDPHIGMYAYAKECGEDFDCDIAERDLLAATDYLVSISPKTEKCLIVNLGDFFHSDSSSNTTTSGTPVDVDTRWARVLQIGIAIMIRMIQRALEHHQQVTVINAIGNHDEQTSVMLSVALRLAFQDNDRVEIMDTVNAFHYFEFGKNLIGVHHGHSVKKENLGKVMAADRPEAWGRTKYRYWLTGHIHHRTVLEDFGVVVESFRTLAGKDAWHTNMGYRAGRDMTSIIYHKEYGESDRHRCDILRARSGKF